MEYLIVTLGVGFICLSLRFKYSYFSFSAVLYVNILFFHLVYFILCFPQMDEEFFNQVQGVCFLCISFILPGEDVFWHGACFHVECLNELGNDWMETIEPDPFPFLIWVMERHETEFESVIGLFLWPASLLQDEDPEWEAAEAEYGPNALETASHNGEVDILLVTDSEGDATKVSAEESAQDERLSLSSVEDPLDESLSLSSDDE